MKNKKYKIKFKTGNIQIIWATGIVQARILAQAEEIKKGNDYLIHYIGELENDS